MRYQQVRTVNGQTITTTYIDKLYEIEQQGSNTTHTSYIGNVALLKESANDSELRYTHQDRLGSTTTMTDHHGTVTAYRSFDPFGKPNGGDHVPMDSYGARARLANNLFDTDQATRRGFTDHEHLDEVEIIQMNGRVYDYNLGRFLSVDPIIQSPGNSQSINPYSYIMNNPLAGTDPSGYCATTDDLGTCAGDLKAGETTAITNGEGNTVGFIGKDADGNIHITNNGSQQGQSAVSNFATNGGSGDFTVGIGSLATRDTAKPDQANSSEASFSAAGVGAGGVGEAESSDNSQIGGLADFSGGMPDESVEEPSYWREFKKVAEIRLEQVTDAADFAVDYWIERDNPIMGTLAATMTRENIANTAFTLTTGALGGGLAGGVRQSYVSSMRELSAFRARLLSKGYSERNIARMLVRGRNLIKDKFRGFKSNYHRPSYEKLSQTRSDARIIQKTTKTNSGVNKMLGAK